MKYICAAIILMFIICNLCGCASVQIPRQSFVRVAAEFTVNHCVEDHCLTDTKTSYASGSIVANKLKTYILTAGHVCDIDYVKLQLKTDHIVAEYYIQDQNGITFKAAVHKLDQENDLCILITQRLGHRPIDIRDRGPDFGEKLYNLASPVGLSSKTYVPLLEGRYSGFNQYAMVFTIPAIGGSSGSPVFDSHGRLVGMIMSVNRKFPMISYSPHYHAIKDLLKGII